MLRNKLNCHQPTDLKVGDLVLLTYVGYLDPPGISLADNQRECNLYLGMAGVVTEIKTSAIANVLSVTITLDRHSKPNRLKRTITTYAPRFTKIGMCYRDYVFVYGEVENE